MPFFMGLTDGPLPFGEARSGRRRKALQGTTASLLHVRYGTGHGDAVGGRTRPRPRPNGRAGFPWTRTEQGGSHHIHVVKNDGPSPFREGPLLGRCSIAAWPNAEEHDIRKDSERASETALRQADLSSVKDKHNTTKQLAKVQQTRRGLRLGPTASTQLAANNYTRNISVHRAPRKMEAQPLSPFCGTNSTSLCWHCLGGRIPTDYQRTSDGAAAAKWTPCGSSNRGMIRRDVQDPRRLKRA